MRILLINPNTTASVTDLAARHVRQVASDSGHADVEFTAVTGRFGASYISSRAAAAIASHAARDANAGFADQHDAVYLACFGDPGLHALREIVPIPVTGMAEAACIEAAQNGRKFSIVTGGALWKPMLTEFVSIIGLSDQLASIRTITLTGGQIAQDPDSSLAALAEACSVCAAQDGADVVILGGAALAGLAERIQPDVPVPVICSVAAGTRAVIASVAAKSQRQAAPPVESINLSAELAALLAQR